MIKEALKVAYNILTPPITSWLPRYHFALKYVSLKSGDVVLDAGCGKGYLTSKIARNDAQVIGVDMSESEISWARKNAKKIKNGGKIEFREKLGM